MILLRNQSRDNRNERGFLSCHVTKVSGIGVFGIPLRCEFTNRASHSLIC